jgi:amphi-Trp domain-containing protein
MNAPLDDDRLRLRFDAGLFFATADPLEDRPREATLKPVSSLIEFDTSATITREQAATHLRTLADHLERHNDVEFVSDGRRYKVDVADELKFEIELEVGNDGNELEIEISG